MKIYPAIDISQGKVVRLKQGRFDQMTVYNDDPIVVAAEFQRKGATLLHVVDLDGAREGRPLQWDILRKLVQSPLRIQAGGGIRTYEDAIQLLELGVDRVVIGSLAVKNPPLVRKLLKDCGGNRITLGLDLTLAPDGEALVAIHGWQETSSLRAYDVLDLFIEEGLEQVLCTDIQKDGMLAGPNHDLYRKLHAAYPELCFLASGGVNDRRDLLQLKRDGIGGAVIGRALYEGSLRLEEAFQC